MIQDEPSNAIVVKNLVKRYDAFNALDHIDLTVPFGECFGSLGPNGAGKTTLIRILTGLIHPTEGEAIVAGHDVAKRPDAVRRSIGVVSQAMTTDLDLTGRENLDIYGKYYQVSDKERRERIGDLLDRVGLTERADDLVAAYSGGMRRRLEIARGLIHRPKILFLDEPTIGLDPQSRRVVWDLLQQFRKNENLTIFLTTHYMDEADLLCDRIAIIDAGKIVVMDSPENLKKKIPGSDIIEISIDGEREGLPASLESLPSVHKVVVEEGLLRVFADQGAQSVPILMEVIRKQGVKVQSISVKQQTLEDVFIHYTGRSIRAEDTKKVSYFIGAGVPRRWGR
ncbi:ATP-binding cassette domain-containing protein [Candidatus Manganitrophus noduliformans]|uniref:ATP-binding cassette domain-containing protein n=1 Tax=Candidatus Manganitrophus noduliformans TaxID=2606439 RepID=A0A7X6DUM6_9BACT|nr:ATP-binding cassette domain-containing protein [Candidatus Manganitrophus noduliformans]NKE73711.1 ATP-binding cassette domain-containing protein [Candidatus Manganitrophus noduliformans]